MKSSINLGDDHRQSIEDFRSQHKAGFRAFFFTDITQKSMKFYRNYRRPFLSLCLMLLPLSMTTGCVEIPPGCVTRMVTEMIEETRYETSKHATSTESPFRVIRIHDDPKKDVLEIFFKVRVRSYRVVPRIVSIPYEQLHKFELCDTANLQISHLRSTLSWPLEKRCSHSNCRDIRAPYPPANTVRPKNPWSRKQVELSNRPESLYLDVHQKKMSRIFSYEKGYRFPKRTYEEEDLVRIVGLLKSGQAAEFGRWSDRVSVLIPWHGKVLYVKYPKRRMGNRPGTFLRRAIEYPLYVPAVAADIANTPFYIVFVYIPMLPLNILMSGMHG